MPEKIQLSIDTPCHEQWDDMQPDSTGRFCGSCQKTVVDFTMMSDQEVLAWFSKASGSVCGRLHTDQMHRQLLPSTPPKRNRWTIWWQLLLAGVLVSAKASAQGKISATSLARTVLPQKPFSVQATPPPALPHILPTPALEGSLGAVSFRPVSAKNALLTIKVIDSVSGDPVPSATVRIDARSFVTDKTGSIGISAAHLVNAGRIEVTYVGYEKKITDIKNATWRGKAITIQLNRSSALMGDVVVVAYPTQKRSVVVGGITSASCISKASGLKVSGAIKDTLTSWLVKSPFTVYPNPVSRGASVAVSLEKLKPGDYSIQLFDNAGALMETMRIEGLNTPRTELLQLPGTLAAGMYFVKIANVSTGKIYTQKLSVQ